MGDSVLGHRHDLDRTCGQTRRLAGRDQDLHRAQCTAGGHRMRAEQDRVPGLRRTDRLEQHRRRRIGDRRDRHDHPDRLGDELQAVLLVGVDHADSLLVLEVVVEELGGDEVLDHLVLEDPEAGLTDRQHGQFGCRAETCPDHRIDDPVHRRLVESAERLGGESGPLHLRVDDLPDVVRHRRCYCVDRCACLYRCCLDCRCLDRCCLDRHVVTRSFHGSSVPEDAAGAAEPRTSIAPALVGPRQSRKSPLPA